MAQGKRTHKRSTKAVKRNKSNDSTVITILAFVILVVLCLSNFGLMGMAGRGIKWLLFGIMGTMGYVFPFLLFLNMMWRAWKDMRNSKAKGKFVCGYILLMLVAAFWQRVMPRPYIYTSNVGDFFMNSAVTKNGGGFIGGVIVKTMSPLALVGTIIVLLALMAIVAIILLEWPWHESRRKGVREKGAVKTNTVRESLTPEERHRRRQERLNIREEGRIRREQLRQERDIERDKRVTARDEFREQSRQRRHEMELKKIEREKELLRERGEVRELEESLKRAEGVDASAAGPVSKTLKRVAKTVHGIGSFRYGNAIAKGEALKENGFDRNADREMIRGTDTGTDQEFERSCDQGYIPHQEPPQDTYLDPADEDVLQQENVDVTVEQERTRAGAGDEIRPERERVRGERKKSPEKMERQDRQEEIYHEEPPVTKVGSHDYVFPPMDLLNKGAGRSKGLSNDVRLTGEKLLQTLKTFGVNAEITNISSGPTVTRYEIQPQIGVKVSKITGLADDIKLNLAAEQIRIEAPIPGKAAIGIEIPNNSGQSVTLYELLASEEFHKSKSAITFAVGEDITGNTVVADIAKMPHLLIAGQTGSGKSVCINAIIMSILYKARPDQVKMIMVDPKRVELGGYNGIPHLLIPVITNPKKASGALNWAVAEMDSRYDRFSELGVRNLAGYNEKVKTMDDPEYQPMPQLLVIIDELADLMMVAPGEVEAAIVRLTQLARAAGIHLIIATQRPSVNVITGLIKANVPSRIAFSVMSQVDSRTILDMQGAEKLLGKGDMLFYPTGIPKPVRVQGAFVSDDEVNRVVEFLKEQNEDNSEDEPEQKVEEDTITSAPANFPGGAPESSEDERDPYFVEAGRFIIEKNKGSIGLLQRNFKIGFNRAARIMDQLSDAGVVGAEVGTKPREILMTEEEFENFLRNG